MPDVIVHAFYHAGGGWPERGTRRATAPSASRAASAPANGPVCTTSSKPSCRPSDICRLVHIDDPNDKRYQGLMITQLVLEDGWVGLAIGPEINNRVAERSRSLR